MEDKVSSHLKPSKKNKNKTNPYNNGIKKDNVLLSAVLQQCTMSQVYVPSLM